jgi:CHASE2 domain-containing sensor protein
MGIREITGYVAHVLLVGYWIWIVSSTAPQLRRGSRDQRVRVQVLLIKTVAVVLSAVVVSVIHFWATHWWHVIAAVICAVVIGLLLRRAYRRLVALPRHRLTLTRRARRFERRYSPRTTL